MGKTLPLIFALAVICCYGCNKSSSSSIPSQSSVMFVNAGDGSGLLLLTGKANSSALPATSAIFTTPLALLANSGYIDVPSLSTVSYSIVSLGSSSIVGTTSGVGTNQHYSYFAYGPVDTLQTLLIQDNLLIPTSGTAKVRFANFCSAKPQLSCYFGTTKVDSPVLYGNVDPFIEVTAGTGALLVKDPTKTAYTASINSQTFVSGKLYTVMFTDTAANGTSGFKLTVITNF